MKFFSTIRPGSIIAMTLAIALLMFGSAYVELRQSRAELFHVLEEHSYSLAETISQSSANVVLSTEQVEQQLAERLLNNAYYIARLDSLGLLKGIDLRTFANANNIYRINIFNSRGERVLGSFEGMPHAVPLKENSSPREILKPILQGTESKLIIGLKRARFEEGERYAVAIRRTKREGGAIVLNLDARQLLEFRRTIGIGKLIRDLGDNTGIEYVAIQDRDGLLAATSDVHELSSIDHDQVLGLALDKDSVIAREVEFKGRQTFEVSKRLAIEGMTVGVLRIGFSMEEIRATENRMTRRIFIITIVLVAVGVLVVTAIVLSQNYTLVTKKYSEMRSLTGDILLNMTDAVVTVDGEDRVTIFNRRAEDLFGTSATGVTGKKLGEIDPRLATCLAKVFAAGTGEVLLECRRSMPRTVAISLSKTTQLDGTQESRTAVLRDLTDSRRMEEELRRNEKLTAMGTLASGVAHEIRNPLNAISMIGQRYEKEFTPRKGLKEYRDLTQVLKKEAARVNGIIRQFLAYARPPQLQRRRIPVEEFVRHVATLFQAQAKAKGVRFSVDTKVDGMINIDAEQMTQALLNLLQNALDATPRKGSIELALERNGHELRISVRDTGVGIPVDKQPKVFDMYFTTKTSGTGMGLTITQQIVSLHNGTIELTSNPGEGTEFCIRLPAEVLVRDRGHREAVETS